jgi:WhiB family redox-sensing transcriptional regulator
VTRRTGPVRTSRTVSWPPGCALGAPVRAECLEFELRVGGAETVGVWGALNEDDRRALHAVWSRRRHFLLQAMTDGEER